uniref:Snurportin-1 n=1 Tax=Zea mays TaxID=4577 RepID=A0A804QUL1_MAIZE
MAPTPEPRRPYKRPAISDQQRRRELALQAQSARRADAQARARALATSLLTTRAPTAATSRDEEEEEYEHEEEEEERELTASGVAAAAAASRLRGSEARRWFARQVMLPEWMVDAPPHLATDWHVFARPSGKRCLVVSSNGMTISRVRNGSILHRFPSALPNGSKRDISGPASSYSILDCIFHEPDETYYIIDMICWRGYSLYDCTAEFRFFWVNSKIAETSAGDPPSTYHRYRFSALPVYECTLEGLQAAYSGSMPYVKDGLVFYNKHAHYQAGITPLALVWKDETCSQYVIDTNNKGEIPSEQHLVLELLEDGKSNLRPGNLLRFAVRDESVKLMDGKMHIGQLQFVGKPNRARAFADSHSKVLFQYAARHVPLRIEDLVASIQSNNMEVESTDVEMQD